MILRDLLGKNSGAAYTWFLALLFIAGVALVGVSNGAGRPVGSAGVAITLLALVGLLIRGVNVARAEQRPSREQREAALLADRITTLQDELTAMRVMQEQAAEKHAQARMQFAECIEEMRGEHARHLDILRSALADLQRSIDGDDCGEVIEVRRRRR